MVRHRYTEQETAKTKHDSCGNRDRPGTMLAQTRALRQTLKRLDHGEYRHRAKRPNGEEHSNEEELPGDEQRDKYRHEYPVEGRRETIKEEPRLLRARRFRRFSLLDA